MSPTHFVSECPAIYQFFESSYDPPYQTNMAYRPGENSHRNNYNPGWRAQPDLSWQSYQVVTPVPQRTLFIDVPYYDQPNPYYQSDPYYHLFSTYNSSFEEKAL